MKCNSLLLTDFYKIGHPFQYPKGTTKVYSNLTPRKSRLEGVDEMVFFGLQYFIKEYLINHFNDNFFNRPKEEVMTEYKRRISTSIGPLSTYKHIEDLYDLGYLPILIKSLPEGTSVKMKIPVLTIVNTLPEFFWLTNFIESLISCIIWQPCTSATISKQYRKILNKYAALTGMPMDFVQWQGHDFSFRGMSSLESAVTSGMGHMLYFTGTDTIPAIEGFEQFYNANSEKELIGASVNATEHSVMCAGEQDDEIGTFHRLLTEVYPIGIVSVVSDSWDLWKVITDYLPKLKATILRRGSYRVLNNTELFKNVSYLLPKEIYDLNYNLIKTYFVDQYGKEFMDADVYDNISIGNIEYIPGKLVIRPDSGNPADIICGTLSNFIEVTKINDSILNELDYFKYSGKLYRSLREEINERYEEYGSEQTTLWEAGIENFYEEVIINNHPSEKGVVELLDEIFGSIELTGVDQKKYKLLDPHIGAIYGDSITTKVAKNICQRLMEKGFASQVVFGIGSYTYQYNTRDTFGTAMKATYCEVNEFKPKFDGDDNHEIVGRNICKDPITDDGTKKSAKGLLQLINDRPDYKKWELAHDGLDNIKLIDQASEEQEKFSLLKPIFFNGKLLINDSLVKIRERALGSI